MSDIMNRVNDELRRVREMMREIAGHVASYSKVTATSALGDDDAVAHYQSDTDEPSNDNRVRRVASWGIAGRPMPGVIALAIRVLASGAQGVMAGISTNRYGRQDLKAGETQIYNKVSGCEVFLDENGALRINAAAGQDVIINGGTLKIARDTDAVNVGTWTHVPASGAGVTPCSLTYTPPGGAPTPIVAPGVAVTGKINGGAAHGKA